MANSTLLDQRLAERYNAASAYFMQLAFDGQVRAVIGCISEERREFGDKELCRFVYTLANQAAAAIAMLDMRARMSARAEHQTALARAARSLNARLDLSGGDRDPLPRVRPRAQGRHVGRLPRRCSATAGLAVAAHGIAKDSDWFGYVIKARTGVGGQVLVTGNPAISNSYRSVTPRRPMPSALGRESRPPWSVPLRWDGELKGALSVAFCFDAAGHGRGHRPAAGAGGPGRRGLHQRAGLRGGKDRRPDGLAHRAAEPRRGDGRTVREEIARARRGGEPLCCLLADLDNFKPINDQHGHLAGDRILKGVATQLYEEFRSYDGIGRFGGDEYLVVLPGTTEEEADRAAERFQDAVAAASARRRGPEAWGLTASEGTSPAGTSRSPPREFIDRADRALLVAKRTGQAPAPRSYPPTATEDELARLESADRDACPRRCSPTCGT